MQPTFYLGVRSLKTIPPAQKPPKELSTIQPVPEPGIPVYRPPALGVNPAYDEALKYILEDKAKKHQQIKEIEEKIKQISQNGRLDGEKTIGELEKEKYVLGIRAEANDPEVRWNFEHGRIDMSRPVYRFLREKKWKNGYLQHLMERVSQMYVVPDVFPELVDPTIDLQFKYGDELEEPGAFQLPVNATKTDIAGGETIVPYIPPHPPKGTKYHRYTFGIYEQPYGKINIGDLEQSKKVQDFVDEHRLKLRGASFFREVWDKDKRVLTPPSIKDTREPVYVKQPNFDPYIDRSTGKNRSTKYPESLNDD
ncbi:12898_t:CDS:2 [Acaulospora colombiana]|uniref:12898_t:CDS:1 n=1 Tax=Acaulospora colombiana TaxID=27376 RepID=A0ACA9KNB1_9GLOM|nr:12898_t:CDS:2 [Acaulospora colombiana]